MADEIEDRPDTDEPIVYDNPELGLTGTPLQANPDGTMSVRTDRQKTVYTPFKW